MKKLVLLLLFLLSLGMTSQAQVSDCASYNLTPQGWAHYAMTFFPGRGEWNLAYNSALCGIELYADEYPFFTKQYQFLMSQYHLIYGDEYAALDEYPYQYHHRNTQLCHIVLGVAERDILMAESLMVYVNNVVERNTGTDLEAESLVCRAEIYSKLFLYDNALTDYLSASELNTTNTTQTKLAEHYAAAGEFAEAIEVLDLVVNTNNPSQTYTRLKALLTRAEIAWSWYLAEGNEDALADSITDLEQGIAFSLELEDEVSFRESYSKLIRRVAIQHGYEAAIMMLTLSNQQATEYGFAPVLFNQAVDAQLYYFAGEIEIARELVLTIQPSMEDIALLEVTVDVAEQLAFALAGTEQIEMRAVLEESLEILQEYRNTQNLQLWGSLTPPFDWTESS